MMPDPGPPSEFGGKIQRNGVQPPPHEPTASEQLSLMYRTGDLTGATDDVPTVFEGLLPEEEQVRLMREAGLLDKGQIWEELNNG
jgi:hypothetical protein